LPQQAVLEPGTFASDSTTLRADGQIAYVGRDAMIEGHALGFYRRAGDGHDDEFLRVGFELGVAAGLRVGGRMWATVEGVGLLAERYDAYPGYENSRLYGDGVVGVGLGYRGRAVQAGVSAYLWRAYAIPMLSATVSVPL
jgi:hypothetical protein